MFVLVTGRSRIRAYRKLESGTQTPVLPPQDIPRLEKRATLCDDESADTVSARCICVFVSRREGVTRFAVDVRSSLMLLVVLLGSSTWTGEFAD